MRLPGARLMRVVGQSMQPALNAGDLVFISTQAYQKRAPIRGEVVAARPASCEGRVIIKRLAGVPKDSLTIDGRAYQLKEGDYFLLGDAAIESTDSRSFGPVRYSELIGPVTRSVWPWRVLATQRCQPSP